jgi:hypothetical protein
MRSLAWLAVTALWLAPLASLSAADKVVCSAHGTSLDFYDTPSDAARAALKAEKLVFVLHVSGHFEDPRFT